MISSGFLKEHIIILSETLSLLPLDVKIETILMLGLTPKVIGEDTSFIGRFGDMMDQMPLIKLKTMHIILILLQLQRLKKTAMEYIIVFRNYEF